MPKLLRQISANSCLKLLVYFGEWSELCVPTSTVAHVRCLLRSRRRQNEMYFRHTATIVLPNVVIKGNVNLYHSRRSVAGVTLLLN